MKGGKRKTVEKRRSKGSTDEGLQKRVRKEEKEEEGSEESEESQEHTRPLEGAFEKDEQLQTFIKSEADKMWLALECKFG